MPEPTWKCVHDWSHWNGDIDYAKVKASGVAAAIVAAGDGCNFFDPKFEENCRGAQTLIESPNIFPFVLDWLGPYAGHLHIYRYLRLGWFDPESHADVCLRDIETARRINPNVFLWLDWEDPSDQCAAMTVLQRQQWASEFLDSLENNGPPDLSYGHYTRATWFDGMLGIPGGKLRRQFFGHPLWVAHYGVEIPTVPQGWAKYGVLWLVWQYSSEGHVEGIPNAFTDLNWARPEFLGQEDDDMADDWKLLDAQARMAIALDYLRVARQALDSPVESLGADIKAATDRAITTAKYWKKWEE